MKKNTVITIIIAALLCVVLLAMNPGNMVVSAEQTVVFSETITGSDTLHVVTFNYPDYRKTLFVEDNASLGTDLLLLPESEEGMVWNWVIDGTDSYLTADTAITENMSVTAVQKVDNLDKDFMNGASGVIVVKVGGSSAYKNKQAALLSRYSDHNESNGKWLAAAVAETSTSNMTAWTFEFAGSCRNNSSNDCYYYVRSSDGQYLNVTSDALSVTGTPAKVLVHKNNLQDSIFYLGNYEGTHWVNLKKDNPEWGFQPYNSRNDGTKLYFYTGASSSLVTLSFDVTGGNRPAPLSYTAYPNDQIILPGYNGTRNGHVFVGWTEDQVTVINPDDTYSIPDTNKTLYAVFDETPTLWLNPLNDGPAISYAKGSEGFPTVYPSSERDGYRLVGWAKTPLSNEAEYEVGDPVELEELTEDMTLYAVWQKITKLTFVPEAGSPIKIISDVGAILDLNQLEDVRPAGRWMYTDESGTSQYVNSNTPFTTPDHDMTLYAVHDVTVTFNGNGADNGNPALIESYTGDIIVLSQQASVSRENYTLLGWKDQSGEFYDDSYVCKQTDDVLTAVWGYTVTFDVNGSKTNVLPVEGRTDDDSFVIPEFTGKKGNNDFLGWTTKTDENGKPIYEQGDQLYHAGDRLAENNEVVAFKYYAIYKVTLTFNSNGGGNISPARSVPNLTPYVDKVDLSEYTADFGTKTFFGWSETKTNTDVLPDEYTIGGTDHTLYAVWGSTVEFDVRGIDASVKSDSDWPETVRGLTTQTFKTAMLSSKYGRSFKGWTDGTNFYEPDVEVPFPNVNSTLYAVWDGSVTVRFDVNGGTAADLQPITQQVGTEFDKFPAYEGTKTGFKFIGWTDSNNLKDGKYHKVYKAGDKYYIPLNADTNIKFYAAWDVADTAAKDNVKFGIRLDGSIPYEPSNYNSSEYTTRAGIDNGNVLFDGVVSSRQWVADSDPSMDKLNGEASDSPEERYYIVNKVTTAVGGNVPSSDKIKSIMQANGRDFNPETEYVLWYVLKWQGNGEGRNLWHVDGVILKKDLNSLHYEGNFDGKADKMPTGFQFMPGQEVTVGDDGKLGNNTNKIPVRGDGYQFMGWNTKADGSGTAYQNGTKFTPTEKNTVLYAQWRESVKTVKLKKEWSDNDNVRGLRPESLLVTLNVKDANGNTFKTYRRWLTANSTDAEGNPKPWYIAVDIPAFDSAGRAVSWEWIEGNNGFVPNYKEVTPRTTVDDLTTITNKLQLISVTGKKTWDDKESRHPEVTVQLYADGTPLAGYTATASDENLTYTFNDLQEYTKSGSRIIYYVRETNTPDGYEVSYDGMNVTNTHYYVTITAEDLTKEYDGTALVMGSTAEYYTVSNGLRRSDSVSSLTLSASRIDAGKTENILPSGAVIVNEKDDDVTSLYTIEYKPGSLTVTPKPVTVTVADKTKVYGDQEPDFDIKSIIGRVKETDSITWTSIERKSGENVGKYTITATGDKYQGNYEVTYVPGTLTITPRPVTVEAEVKTKVYGDADEPLTAKVTGPIGGDSVAYTLVRAEGENVGDYLITPNGDTVQGNYTVIYKTNQYHITKRPLTITAKGTSKVYDGTALTLNEYTNGTLAFDDKIDSVEIAGSIIEVGSTDNKPSGAKISSPTRGDVTNNYEFVYENGTLEVKQRPLTIIAGSAEKYYDEKPLTENSYVIKSGTSLAEGDDIDSVTITGSQTEPGSSKNKASDPVIKNKAGKDVTGNYDISYEEGTLTVKIIDGLWIKANSAHQEYNGKPLTESGYTYAESVLAAGHHIKSVDITDSLTDVDKIDNVPSNAVIVDEDGNDVTLAYRGIRYLSGTLEVTPKPLVIRADSATKLHDGTPLTNENYLYDPEELAENDRIESVVVTGSQTEPGESDNIADDAVILNAGDNDVTGNYAIRYEPGKLVVTIHEGLIIRAASSRKVYDGTALEDGGYTFKGLSDGDHIESVIVTGSQTVVGTSENIPSDAVILDAEGNDVTLGYVISYESGTLEVTPRQLVITAGSAEKVYDGSPLTNDGYTFRPELVTGDRIDSVTVTGSQTTPGSSENVASDAHIVDADGEDMTANYTISYEPGLLTVTMNDSLIIRANSAAKVYDGTALTQEGYTAAGLAAGDRIEIVTITGSQTNVGVSENVPSAAKIVDAQGNDVTSGYDITYISGTLEVTPKTLLIRADSDAKVYDGTSLHRDSYTSEPLAAGDRFESVTVTGSRISVGTSENVASDAVIMNADGEVVTGNYTITYIKGNLYVEPRPVIVTADSFSKGFGQVDMPFTAKVVGTLNGDTVTYELSREPGEDAGEYPITASGRERQGNYIVSFFPGLLTITWNPTVFTVEKIWADDNNRDGIRPISLAVSLIGSDGTLRTRRLSDANGWKATISELPLYKNGAPITYSWTEEAIDGYTGSSVVNGNATVITNTHEIARTSASVNKIWDDRENAGGTRPSSLGVILRGNGETILSLSLNDGNNWSAVANNLPMYENGSLINYVWYEQTVGGGYYAVSSTTSGNNTTLVNSNLYTITIRYQYADGSEAAATYTGRLGVGETFAVESPEIDGFVASLVSVVGMMPAHDVEFVVIYAAEGETIVTPTPTPIRPIDEPEPEPEPVKDVPEPREVEPDEEHPVIVEVPNILIDIDDLGTALGLGEVFINNGGYSLE